MIIGLFLRHYKIYNNINNIPISNNLQNKLSLFIGNNGVGKSSILEALNTFFNNGYWNRTKGEKQDQTFICPIFLINKEKFNNFFNLSNEDISVLEIISKYMYSLEVSSINKESKEFVNTRDSMDLNQGEFYLLILGSNFKDRNKVYFGSSFDKDIRVKIIEEFPNYKIDKLLTLIKSYYTLIYIPVESKTDEILKLEAKEMQKLMNKNILETIETVLTEKRIHKVNNNKRSTLGLVSVINQTLNTFMDDINNQIKTIDDDYSFKVEEGYKKNLTASDLRDEILKAYFAIRTLKKSGKEIFELSSGEQRIALIDIATAFIKNNTDSKGEVVLAIDEPEASLHISKCFNQFKRIERLSHLENIQVLITTHWYGSLPTLQNGTLNHIQFDEKINFKTFSLDNYLEQRRDFPDDIDLKSFFELVSTIISSIKSDNTKWLIVEGSDDYLYFDNYLGSKIKDLVILPVGGCGNVIKVYEYLFAPFCEKIEKGILENSKVLCIIDSDINQKSTNLVNGKIEKSLKISRLQNFDNEISLQNLTNIGNYSPTTIEDCLNPTLFYEAIKEVLLNEETEFVSYFNQFEFNSEFLSSRLSGENSLLMPIDVEAYKNKKQLLDKINSPEIKNKIAKTYCKLLMDNENLKVPKLFEIVSDFFEEE